MEEDLDFAFYLSVELCFTSIRAFEANYIHKKYLKQFYFFYILKGTQFVYRKIKRKNFIT